jgi:hypothetical protein
MLEQRKQNRYHPDVLAILGTIWKSVKRHHGGSGRQVLGKEEYRTLHTRLVGVFNRGAETGGHDTGEDMGGGDGAEHHALSPEEAEKAFEDDWEMDSCGDGMLEKDGASGI